MVKNYARTLKNLRLTNAGVAVRSTCRIKPVFGPKITLGAAALTKRFEAAPAHGRYFVSDISEARARRTILALALVGVDDEQLDSRR